MRVLGFVFFIAVFLGIDFAVHWYIWIRLFRDPSWPTWVRIAGGTILALLAVALPLGMILWRALPSDSLGWFTTALFVWMGSAFYLLLAMWGVDIARLIAGTLVEDPERRKMLLDGAVKVAGVAAIGASAAALRSGLGEVEVKEVQVELERMPKELSGMTIVQLTDVHVGQRMIDTKFIQRIVERVNEQKADAVVITGDLVDGSVDKLGDTVALLAKIDARFGVYFVTGNHEYYSGARDWIAFLKKHGIKTLQNEHARLGDQVSIDLAGINDVSAARMTKVKDLGLASATANRDPDRELILLAHQPKAITEAAKYGVGLQISGHTHGGQIQPFGAIVSLTQPYMAGLYDHDEKTKIYVSRGTGFWGPPMRLFAPAEITKIVLGAKA
jgi:predicted MPP superfamily phosphohydrolase